MPARRSYRCLYTASPASQNAPWLALRFSFLEDRQFCRVSDARRDRWEHQNEHFVRDFLQFSHFVASKSTFSYVFSLEPENLQPQNRCFVRGFRQFSAHRTKCHDCHGISTLSPLDAALPMRFAQNTQHDTSKVLRLPRRMTMDTSKVLRLPRKLQHIF